MRDTFGYVFEVTQEETKPNDVSQNTNFKGYVSSNGYYGYQAVQKENANKQQLEYMDTQTNDSGVQFNNYIPPEDRLSDIQEVEYMRGPFNRKRQSHDDAFEFKKRRKVDTSPELTAINRHINLRQPTHNVPDIPRYLMGHYI